MIATLVRLAAASFVLAAVCSARVAEHIAPKSSCSLFPISAQPERALYNITTSYTYVGANGTDLPPQVLTSNMSALFGDCSVVAVAQSIPLTPMEFARLYETTLRQVREDSDDGTLPSPPTTLQTRPACDRLVEDLASNKNYRARVLDAVVGPEDPALANAPAANDTAALVEAMRENGKQRTAVATLAGRPVQYAVCSTDTWDNTLVINTPGNGKDEGGRQLTYIAFLNSCPDYDARVKLDIVPAGPADEYCDELDDLNSGLTRARVALLTWFACATVLLWVLVLFCTCCCTCWCCCNKEGRFACACSRVTRGCWDRMCIAVGLGWILRGAPVHINAAGVSRMLLLSALCIPAFVMYQQLHVPWFQREDVIDLTIRTSIHSWAITSDNRRPALKLLDALQRGIGISVPGFASTWLYFSHPQRDEHFRSKFVLAALALLITTMCNASMLLDLLSYFAEWRRKGFHIIVMLSIVLSTVAAWVALVIVCCYKKPLTRTETLSRKGSEIAVADAVSDPEGKPLAVHAVTPGPDPAVARRWQVAARGARVGAAPALQRLNLAALTAQVQAKQHIPATSGAAEDVLLADAKLVDSDERWRHRWQRRAKTLFTSRVATLPRRAWDAIREEPDFRYSPYFTSALVIAFVILTASLATAIALVEELARCTQPESQCLRNAQRWIFENLVAGYAGAASVEAAESLALSCDAAGIEPSTNGTASLADTLDPQLQAQCAAARAARSLYDSSDTPRWVLDGRIPVLVGGKCGFAFAYLLGMYTILHICTAYKRFVKTISATPGLQSLPRTKPYGTDPLQDFSAATLGQSSYFAGMLVSTCWVQLWWAGATLGVIFAALLHPEFWRLVERNIAWPISVVAIVLWHILSQLALMRWVTPGTEIKRPLLWFYLFSLLSTVYFTVGFLLALWRLLQLYFTTMIAMSRLERSLFTIFARADRGYASFLAMVAMIRVLDLQAEVDAQQAAAGDSLAGDGTVPQAPANLEDGAPAAVTSNGAFDASRSPGVSPQHADALQVRVAASSPRAASALVIDEAPAPARQSH